MNKPFSLRSHVVFLALICSLGLSYAQDAKPIPAKAVKSVSLAHLLPEGAIAVAETNNLGRVYDSAKSSVTLKTILNSAAWKDLVAKPEYQQYLAGKNLIDTQLGGDSYEIAKQLLGDQVIVAIYPDGRIDNLPGVAVIRTEHATVLRKTIQKLSDTLTLFAGKDFKRESAAKNGNDPAAPIAGQFKNRVFFIQENDWLVVASRKELLEKVAAECRAGNDPAKTTKSLVQDPHYRKQAASSNANDFLRAYAKSDWLRKLGNNQPPKKPDNVVGALLVLGPIACFLKSDVLTAHARLEDDRLYLETNIAADQAKLSKTELSFFEQPARQEAGRAKAAQLPTDSLFHFAMYRDFETLYKSREDLLDPQILPEFDKFEAGIGNLMPGRNFTQDLLPVMGNSLRFIISPQSYAHLVREPSVKIPGFALEIEPRASEDAADVVDLIFQTLVTIVNLQVLEKGIGDPMVIAQQKISEHSMNYSRHVMRLEAKKSTTPLAVNYNFTPSSAKLDGRFVISSSKTQCEDLIRTGSRTRSTDPRKHADPVGRRDFEISIWLAPTLELLKKNQPLLEARLIQDGRRPERAKQELADAYTLLEGFQYLDWRTDLLADRYRSVLELGW